MSANTPQAAPVKERKKQRRFRQAFARFLQRTGRRRGGIRSFEGALQSVAILAQEKLGDAILLTPLIGNLRRAFPGLAIHVIAFSNPVFDFFSCDRNVTAVHHAKKRPLRYLRDVLFRRFDLLFNTKDHPSTHFLIQSILIRSRVKAGIANPFHEGLYDLLADPGWHTHIVVKNCALLDLLGVPHTPEGCRPYIPEMAVQPDLKAFADRMPEGGPAGINISAGGPLRYWTEEKWGELVRRFPDIRFIVFSAPGDLEAKRRLETLPNVVPSPATGNLYEVSLLVRKLRILVTPDTSLVHIASCHAVPVVGLYREAPQDLSRFSPYLTEHTLVASKTSRVADIGVDEVAASLLDMLRKRPST